VVGELLKKAREESGKDIKEVSSILKIRADYLRAIEEGDFKNLPEEVYVKGYIREYAEFLHISPETALSAYAQQTSPPTDTNGEPPAKVISGRKKLKTMYILIPLILVIFGLLLFAVLYSPEEEPEIPGDFSETREVIPPPPPLIEPAEETTQLPVETKKEEPPPLTGTDHEIPAPSVDIKKKPPPDGEHAKKPPSNTALPKHTLQVIGVDTVWFLITADNGDPQEMTLKQGETVTFQAQEGFYLKIGNAGGAKIIFNGKELGKLGEKGQIVTLNLPKEH